MSGKYKIDVTPDITGTRMDKNGHESPTTIYVGRIHFFYVLSWSAGLSRCHVAATKRKMTTIPTIPSRRAPCCGGSVTPFRFEACLRNLPHADDDDDGGLLMVINGY